MIKRIHSTSSAMTKLGKIICQFVKVLLLSMLILYYVLDHPKIPMVNAQSVGLARKGCNCYLRNFSGETKN